MKNFVFITTLLIASICANAQPAAGISLGVGQRKTKAESITVETNNLQFAAGLAAGVYLYIM